jgi:tetratricopeptide (TPR) repeat protein
MAERVPFIGRSQELRQIETRLAAKGEAHVMCVIGRGGIGKTRLLEEIRHQYHTRSNIIVTDIINFDDRAFHYVENLERHIIGELGAPAFEAYYRELQDLRQKARDRVVSPYQIAEQRQQVHQTFVEEVGRIAVHKQLVVLFDTLEKMRGVEVEQFLLNLMARTRNTLFLLAGRDDADAHEFRSFRERLEKELPVDRVTIHPLAALLDDDGRSYLRTKQRQLFVTIEPDLAEKILVLAEGRPVLLDLAVEWLSRHMPLDWMDAYSLDKIKNFSADELSERQQEFEAQLVRYITRLRTPLDQLLLLMSRIFPFDTAMIGHFLELSPTAAEALFAEVSTSVFAKVLPRQRLTLHDEMRRLINAHVWSELDQSGDRQKRDSRRAINYFSGQVTRVEDEISQVQAEEQTTNDAAVRFEKFIRQEVLKFELWTLWEQQLFHTLFTDKDAGVKLFFDLVAQTSEEYEQSLPLREVLLRHIRNYIRLAHEKPYLATPDAVQIHAIEIVWAKFLLDSGRYPEAETVLQKLLARNDLRVDHQIDANIQLANVVIRQGRFFEGIGLFEKAVATSKKNRLVDWRGESRKWPGLGVSGCGQSKRGPETLRGRAGTG